MFSCLPEKNSALLLRDVTTVELLTTFSQQPVPFFPVFPEVLEALFADPPLHKRRDDSGKVRVAELQTGVGVDLDEPRLERRIDHEIKPIQLETAGNQPRVQASVQTWGDNIGRGFKPAGGRGDNIGVILVVVAKCAVSRVV